MAAFDRLKIVRPVDQRVPTDEKIGSWLTKEGYPFLASVRKIVNWLCDYMGYSAVDSTDTPGSLETKIVDGTHILVTKSGAEGARTLSLSLAPDYRVWDPTFYIAGTLNSAEVLASFPVVRYANLAATLAGAFGSVLVAPLADATITIKKNSTSVGTITIASGALQCVFACSADVDLTPGADYLNFVNQAVADAQMSGLRVCIPGVRT